MKKYFVKNGLRDMVQFDSETQNIDVIDYLNSRIDWMYHVPEDGELQIEGKEKISVEKGDFVILFYMTPGLPHNAIVIKSKEWKENIEFFENREKEYSLKRELPEAGMEETCCDMCSKN